MNKRSAAIVAAGLVAVLALGGFAYSRGLTGPSVSAAAAGERVSHPKPMVRTHTKRVVVHRSAPTPAPRIVFSQSASSGVEDQDGSDDGVFDDDGEDHENEGLEDQDDQEQQDDQSDVQDEGDDD